MPTTGDWCRASGCWPATTRTPTQVFDALTSAGIPVEIVGLVRPARGCPRSPRSSPPCTCIARRDRQRLAADPADRAALGDRPARPAPPRRNEPPSSRGRRGVEPDATDDRRPAARDRRRCRPGRGRLLGDALDDPGDLPYSAEALERFALLSAELRMLRSHVGEPLLDLVRRVIDSSGRRHRARLVSRSGGRWRAATTSTCS